MIVILNPRFFRLKDLNQQCLSLLVATAGVSKNSPYSCVDTSYNFLYLEKTLVEVRRP